MHTDPNPIGFIGEDVEVMIAAADGAKLRRRNLLQLSQWSQTPGRIFK
jgi:hypothetical protein